MKKRMGALILILALMLGGCTSSGEDGGAVTSASGSSGSVPESGEEESISAPDPSAGEANGSGISKPAGDESQPEPEEITVQEIEIPSRYGERISLEESQGLLLVDESTVLPDRVPVYRDPCPVDHGEPEYEFTDEVKEIRRGNLTDFLDILYGNHEEREFDIAEEGSRYLVSYQADRLEAWGREYGIHVYTKEYGVREDAENGNLLNNELILAALEYTGIRQPQVRRNQEYKGNGKAQGGSIYIITEQSEDLLESMRSVRFKSISVGLDTQGKKNRDTVRVVIEKNEPEEMETCETVSYEQALQYVREKYADKNVSAIRAEACYERKAAKGYFVPCYKFYVEYEQDKGAGGYDVTYILMAKGWSAQTLQKANANPA